MGLIRNVFIASLAILGSNAMSAVIDLIPSNFDDVVLKSGKPSLVEFFAPWCGRMYLLSCIPHILDRIVTVEKHHFP
jgi:protein disulfide-isomerase A6